MTWNDVLMYAIEAILKLLILSVFPYLFYQVRKVVKSDIQAKYIDQFEQLVIDAVNQVQQTYVADMKAENLFDKEAQAHAFYMVKNDVLAMMNSRMQQIVMDAVGDFDEYIRNKIEAEVYRMKQDRAVNVGSSEGITQKADA